MQLGAPLRPCSLPVLLHFSTPHKSAHDLRLSNVGRPQAQLDPNQEEGNLTPDVNSRSTSIESASHLRPALHKGVEEDKWEGVLLVFFFKEFCLLSTQVSREMGCKR